MGHDGFHSDVAGIYQDLMQQQSGVRAVGHRNYDTARLQFNQVLLAYCWAKGSELPTVLDVGCGPGYLYRHMREAGCPAKRYVGIDTNQKWVGDQFLRDLGDLEEVHRVVGDVRDIPKTPTFDVVACIGTLAWYDQEQAMQIAGKCWELTKAVCVFVMHADTTALDPMDIVEYLPGADRWIIDHSYDRFSTGVRLYKKP